MGSIAHPKNQEGLETECFRVQDYSLRVFFKKKNQTLVLFCECLEIRIDLGFGSAASRRSSFTSVSQTSARVLLGFINVYATSHNTLVLDGWVRRVHFIIHIAHKNLRFGVTSCRSSKANALIPDCTKTQDLLGGRGICAVDLESKNANVVVDSLTGLLLCYRSFFIYLL